MVIRACAKINEERKLITLFRPHFYGVRGSSVVLFIQEMGTAESLWLC